jgi:hypothetical protein
MKPENIVLYGRSLGSGPSCYLAEKLQKENIQIGGLILQVFTLSQIKLRNNFILHFFSSSKIITITYHFWNILPASPWILVTFIGFMATHTYILHKILNKILAPYIRIHTSVYIFDTPPYSKSTQIFVYFLFSIQTFLEKRVWSCISYSTCCTNSEPVVICVPGGLQLSLHLAGRHVPQCGPHPPGALPSVRHPWNTWWNCPFQERRGEIRWYHTQTVHTVDTSHTYILTL